MNYDAYNNSYGNFAGTYLEQCLPNITGRMNAGRSNYTRAFQGIYCEGAFYVSGRDTTHSFEWYFQNWTDTSAISMDASRLYSGNIYRNNCSHSLHITIVFICGLEPHNNTK